VPGLLEERVTALLRGLPKQTRKAFVPIPETAARLAARLTPSDRPLVQAVAEGLKEMTGVQVPEDAWDEAGVPDHLRMKFRLVDEQGRRVAVGDDFRVLKRRFGGTGSRVLAHIPTEGLDREAVTRWDFGVLPERVDLERGGIRLRGYPALVDQGGSVAIRVLDSEEGAVRATRAGLRRLFMLGLGSDLRDLRRSLPGLDRMRLQYAKAPVPAPENEDLSEPDPGDGRQGDRGSKPPDLAVELIALVLDRTFVAGLPPVRDPEAFAARLADHRPRLMTVAAEVCELAGRILERYQAARKRLSGITQVNWMPSVLDLTGQLDALVYRGFLERVPYEQLKEYPRYLRAAEARAEKLFHAAGKDQQRMREMAPLLKKWQERAGAARASGRSDPRVEEIRWMLEELRVSLFAQQLGTAYPVSVKRIEARWRELGL
jgi:ATP-dependent helicase HrpA